MLIIELRDFTGGLNTEQAPTAIADNEAVIFENWEVGTWGIRRRKGFQSITSTPDAIFNGIKISPTEWLFVTENWNVKRYDENTNTWTDVGTVSGGQIPKLTIFEPYVAIATGQLYLVDLNTDTISNPTTYPAVDVLSKNGRLWICGDDYVRASRVGDPTDWTTVSGDDASAQYVEVGYKDGGDVIGFTTLFDDVIVFKTSGIYRLQGSFPNVAVSLVSRHRRAKNHVSFVSLGSDVIAYDEQGAYSVSASFRYGDLVFDDIDRKVKSFLKERYRGRMFYLPTLRAIAFQLTDGLLLYFYQTKTFVVWKNEVGINILLDDGLKVLGIARGEVFQYTGVDDSYSQFIAEDTRYIADATTPINDTRPINAVYCSKRTVSTYPFVIQRVGGVVQKYTYNTRSSLDLYVGKVKVNIILEPTSPYISEMDTVYIADANEPIAQTDKREVFHFHQVQRVEDFYVSLYTSDPLIIQGVVVEGQVRRS